MALHKQEFGQETQGARAREGNGFNVCLVVKQNTHGWAVILSSVLALRLSPSPLSAELKWTVIAKFYVITDNLKPSREPMTTWMDCLTQTRHSA